MTAALPAITSVVFVWETQSRTLSGWAASVWRDGDRRLDLVGDVIPLPGWQWETEWEVSVGDGTDADGWQYSSLLSGWTSRGRLMHTMRRRAWARTQRRREDLL